MNLVRKKIYKRIKAGWRFFRLNSFERGTLLRRRIPGRLGIFLAAISGDFTSFSPTLIYGTASLRQIGVRINIAAVPHPTTGSGHRFSEWNTGLMLAEALGARFISSRIGDGWDEAYNIVEFPEISNFLRNKNVRIARLPRLDNCLNAEQFIEKVKVKLPDFRNQDWLFILGDGQCFYEQHHSMETLRGLQISRAVVGQKIRIAVHVRRGDIADMKLGNIGDWQRRYVNIDWFSKVLTAVLEGLPESSWEIDVFSQDCRASFLGFFSEGDINFRLNENAHDCFRDMVAADILITSPSSYSFNAGLLSSGLKISRVPWWHAVPESEEWIGVDNDLIDTEYLTARVRRWHATRRDRNS